MATTGLFSLPNSVQVGISIIENRYYSSVCFVTNLADTLLYLMLVGVEHGNWRLKCCQYILQTINNNFVSQTAITGKILNFNAGYLLYIVFVTMYLVIGYLE